MIQDTQTTAGRPFAIPPQPENPKTSFLSNILAIAGFIIIIVVVIWGLVHLANLSRSWFSSFFGTSGANIEITAPETAVSGKAFTVTWKYEPSTSGTYAFLYQCAGGLQFRTSDASGALTEIPCGAAYTTAASDNTLSLTPFNPATSTISLPLSIIFLPSGEGEQAQGSATVAIAPASTVAPIVTTRPTISTSPSTDSSAPQQISPRQTTLTPTPRPVTPADISVRIVSVYTDTSGFSTATFEIANIGGSATGSYYFTAQLPTISTYSGNYYGGTMQGYTYTSPMQTSLGAGDRIVNTLRFTQIRPEGGTFSVQVDPYGSVRESNKTNNFASQFVSAPNYYQYNNQYDAYLYNQQYPYSYAQGYGGTQYSYAQGYGGMQYTQYYPYAY